MIIASVYIKDFDISIDSLQDYKKHLKTIIQTQFYPQMKLTITNLRNQFNNSIKNGCIKVIELLFTTFEVTVLRKLFTLQWNPEVVESIFAFFKSAYNSIFCKLFSKSNNSVLIIIARLFIDIFINYYMEELIHTVRTTMRHKAYISDFKMVTYEPKYLKCYKIDKDQEAIEEEEEDNISLNETFNTYNTSIGKIKDLDAIEKPKEIKKKDSKKKKLFSTVKYNFPKKIMDNNSKKIDYKNFIKNIENDLETFIDFLEGFKEESKEPFSKIYPCIFGDNFINANLNKFICVIEIIKCKKADLSNLILGMYRENYNGDLGRVLLECIFCIREDHKDIIKNTTEKKFLIKLYETGL